MMERKSNMKTLEGFPEDFLPLVVVTGDRRENPPQSKGDLLVYSFSTTDVMHINRLRIPVPEEELNAGLILSDKQFVIDTEEILRQRFGTMNILVIGSPAVNLLARRINEGNMFKFSISEDTKLELEEQNHFIDEYLHDEADLFIYKQCLEGIFDVNAILKRFVDLYPHIDELREKANQIIPLFRETMMCRDVEANIRPIKRLLHKLDKPGILDSLARINRGESISAYKDYGLISVSPNPFSESKGYSVVYVAGVSGPGTAFGIKLLGDKKSFTKHPYGGVFEVNIDRFASYFEKIQRSTGRWETRGYKEKEYREAPKSRQMLRVFLSSPAGKDDVKQRRFNNEIQKLLHDACKIKGLSLEIEEPYSLPMGVGHNNFWEIILAYEKKCDFVLHDMTGCARGVMVEVGFSIGAGRPYFLLWNIEKKPVKNWKEMHIPKLLPVTHIEQLDTTDVKRTKNTLRKKILEPAVERHSLIECASLKPLVKDENVQSVFVYCREPTISNCLDRMIQERGFRKISHEESDEELEVCQIRDVLNVADFVIIELSDNNLDSFIILGLTKAMSKKMLIVTFDRYNKNEFAWAKDAIRFTIDNIERELEKPLSKFFTYA